MDRYDDLPQVQAALEVCGTLLKGKLISRRSLAQRELRRLREGERHPGHGLEDVTAAITAREALEVIGAVFLLNSLLDPGVFAGVLYASILVLAFLHVAPFRTRKVGGRWYYGVTAYVIILTTVYSYMLMTW